MPAWPGSSYKPSPAEGFWLLKNPFPLVLTVRAGGLEGTVSVNGSTVSFNTRPSPEPRIHRIVQDIIRIMLSSEGFKQYRKRHGYGKEKDRLLLPLEEVLPGVILDARSTVPEDHHYYKRQDTPRDPWKWLPPDKAAEVEELKKERNRLLEELYQRISRRELYQLVEHSYSGKMVLLTSDGMITATERSRGLEFSAGKKNFPGGGAGKGETFSETALREAGEEMGLTREEVRIVKVKKRIPRVLVAGRPAETVAETPFQVFDDPRIHTPAVTFLARTEYTSRELEKGQGLTLEEVRKKLG